MAFGGIGEFLTQKIGPVPMWAIVGVGGVGIAIFAPKLLAKLNIGGSSDASTSTPPASGTGSPSAPYGPSPTPPTPPNPQGGGGSGSGGPTGPNQPAASAPVRFRLAGGGLGRLFGRGRGPAQPVGPAGAPGGPLEPPGRRGPPDKPGGPAQPIQPTRHRMPPQPLPEPTPPGITPTPTSEPRGPAQPLPGRQPGPTGPRGPAEPLPPPPMFVHPMAWPQNASTLSGIAAQHGVTAQRLESLNPWIHQERGTWDLIYPSDEIRIA